MKIIVSHDVDHLYALDHWLHDLIIPKHWIRSVIFLCKRKIGFRVFFERMILPFRKSWNHMEEVLKFDKSHQIPSTFFFGMDRVLGMSYSRKSAKEMIQYVQNQTYDAGVHGVDFQNFTRMEKEYREFKKTAGKIPFGIRMHCVRKDERTLEKLAQIGYLFDSTDFDKTSRQVSGPYKVGRMWEIPLHIMDGYVWVTGDMEQSRVNTLRILKRAEEEGLPYCTILFHDVYYDSRCYPMEKEWYEWLIGYLEDSGYEFISFKSAVKELENSCGC